jgi:hypothetical protein
MHASDTAHMGVQARTRVSADEHVRWLFGGDAGAFRHRWNARDSYIVANPRVKLENVPSTWRLVWVVD